MDRKARQNERKSRKKRNFQCVYEALQVSRLCRESHNFTTYLCGNGVFPRRVSAPYYGPKWQKYKYLLLAEFSVRTVNYGPTLFPSIYDPSASRLGHKSMEKNEDP